MLSFIYNYRNCDDLLDTREIATRRHVGIFFKEIVTVHHKAKQNPLYRAISAWNKLPVHVRNAGNNEVFKRLLILEIQNPFMTFV